MATSSWDIEALSRFPDQIERFEDITSIYQLWDELVDIFKESYRYPENKDLISRIYQFAFWCCEQPSGQSADDDLRTCVYVSFFEEIPTIEAAIPDMPNWFSRSDALEMKSIFSHLVGDEGYQIVLKAYDSDTHKNRKLVQLA